MVGRQAARIELYTFIFFIGLLRGIADHELGRLLFLKRAGGVHTALRVSLRELLVGLVRRNVRIRDTLE